MLDKRYQVFITTSGNEMQPERMVVSQTLIGMGFFSWGLEQRTPVSTAFARRQIDDCDYVLLLLGSQYGEQSVSGVSYMHLEYIYAVTKQKPIIVLMHESPENREPLLQEQSEELKSRFQNFRHQLQKEAEQVIYYKSLRDLELAVRSHMHQMLERYPVVGWVRPQSIQTLQDEIDRLKSQLAQAQKGLLQNSADPFLSLPAIALDDVLRIDYRMNAYQEGHFKEIIAIRELTWAQILKILSVHFEAGLAEEYFSKILNQYLNDTGLEDAQRQMPRAHQISRAQINVRILYMIKRQMQANNWIVPIGRDQRQRMLWKVTQQSKMIVKNENFIEKNTRII